MRACSGMNLNARSYTRDEALRTSRCDVVMGSRNAKLDTSVVYWDGIAET